ncbi:MAG: hypothetical protein M5R40_08140 [Anaerolineae bacterium]|nr:hypothetical protein [Anaerolineae bacterium]
MNYVATTGTDDYLVVVLNDGQAFTEAYFGYRPTGTADISGRVWNDANGDGNQDPAEVGLNGVQVQLWRDDGDNSFSESTDVLFDTVITAGDGDYVFDNLPAATYFVNVDGGTIPSLPDPPTLTGGTNPAGPIALANGASETADFGYQLPNDGIIQGLVWDDEDGDNVIDGSEAGLPDVRLTLLLDDGDGDFSASDDLPVAIQDTASDGSYSFANVADDELYFVVVTESTLPPGYTRVDATGNENPRPVDTSTGGPEYEENFAYRISDNIGFTLTPALLTWTDAEPGEEQGFTHTLENTGDVEDEYTVYFNCAAVPSVPSPTCTIVSGNQGWSVNDQLEIVLPDSSTVTAQSGSGLGVTFTLQPGETATLSHTIRVPLGSVAAGTQDTSRIAVQSAASGEDQQADDQTTVPIVGTITGSVFHDINSNAVQDPGEPGLPDITLSVFRVVGAALQPLNITVESNADGAFTFTGLPANGNFAVFVDADDPDLPAGLAIANDRRNVTLTNGQQGTAVSFPFISPAPADPQLSKTVSPTSVPAGSTITYTLTVRNNGQQAATNVVVTDPVSTYVTVSSALVSPVGRARPAQTPSPTWSRSPFHSLTWARRSR